MYTYISASTSESVNARGQPFAEFAWLLRCSLKDRAQAFTCWPSTPRMRAVCDTLRVIHRSGWRYPVSAIAGRQTRGAWPEHGQSRSGRRGGGQAIQSVEFNVVVADVVGRHCGCRYPVWGKGPSADKIR